MSSIGNLRPYKRSKHMRDNMSGSRYKELCGFCEQYPEWKKRLRTLEMSLKSPSYDGMPHSVTNNITNQTEDLAMERAEISKKIDLVDRAAREVGDDVAKYIISNVCYGDSIDYLIDIKKMPYSSGTFKRRRSVFFVTLSNLKK